MNKFNIILMVVILVLINSVLFIDIDKNQKLITLALIVVLSFTALYKTKNLDFNVENFQDVTNNVTTQAPTTQAPTTQPRTTQGMTTQGMTTQGMTTQGMTTQGMTTQGMTTQGMTTQGMTTQGMTTQGMTTQGMTTQALTTQAPTTQGMTTQALTTQARTTQGITTQGMTTQGMTTQGMTTQGMTTQGMTTQGMTTQGMTTQGMTTQGMTTQGMTTQGMTTQGMTTQAPTTQAPTTQPRTTQPRTTQAMGIPTVVALQASGSNQLTIQEGLENISQVFGLMEFSLLEVTRELLGIALHNSDVEMNVAYNLALIKELIGEMKRIKQDVPETLSQEILDNVEYQALRNTVMYLVLNLKINEIELVERVFVNIFSIPTTSLDIEGQRRCDELLSKNTLDTDERREKLLCLNTKTQIIAELMVRIGERIRNVNSRGRMAGGASQGGASGYGASQAGASGYGASQAGASGYGASSGYGVPQGGSYGYGASHGGSSEMPEIPYATGYGNHSSPDDPYGAGDGSSSHVDQQDMSRYLTPPSVDNIATYFRNLGQETRDRVHNVGVPVKNFMTHIIRPTPVAERNCLKDRRFPREPVEVLSQGTPAGAYEFQGVGTMLPKFAYTEVHNDNYY
jgi:hypothetical protein